MTENTATNYSRERFLATMMMGTGLVALAIMFFILASPHTDSAAAPTSLSAIPATVDFEAPRLDLRSLDGESVSLLDYRGSVILVNLWATWCPPCREEMPALQDFFEKYEGEGFVLVGVNQEEARGVVEPFVRELGLTFPIWLDEDYLAQREFNTISLPSSYVIDRAGRVRLMWLGGISRSNLEKYVPALIAK